MNKKIILIIASAIFVLSGIIYIKKDSTFVQSLKNIISYNPGAKKGAEKLPLVPYNQEIKQGIINIAKITIKGMISDVQTLVDQLYQLRLDDTIHGIFIIIDSEGGRVPSSALLASEIKNCSEVKPVVAFAVRAFSGGYWAISNATHIIACPMADIGSIGVYTEIAKKTVESFEEDGLKGTIDVEMLSIGEDKLVSHDFGPELTDKQRENIQKSNEIIYRKFCQDVAQGRNISLADSYVWAEGRKFIADEELISLGLIDEIGSYSDAIDKIHKLAQEKIGSKGQLTIIPIESASKKQTDHA